MREKGAEMLILTGTHTTGITLLNTDVPALLSGYITNDGAGSAVFGSGAYNWDVRNTGTIGDGSTNYGVNLVSNSIVRNGSAISTHAKIAGKKDAVYLHQGGIVYN